jgi:hypothetical protein
MIVSETVFDAAGEALGLIEQDLHAGLVTFRPHDGNKRLSARQWRRLADCRKDVLAYYARRKK